MCKSDLRHRLLVGEVSVEIRGGKTIFNKLVGFAARRRETAVRDGRGAFGEFGELGARHRTIALGREGGIPVPGP